MKKRVISAALAAALLSGVIPSAPVFAEDEPIILGTQHSEAADCDENYAYVMMGTVQSEVDERGRYVLTLYREGNTDIEASAVLKTADVSARYGVDYIIDDEAYETTEEDTSCTLLELSSDEENVKAGNEALEEMNSLVASSAEDAEEDDDAEQTTEQADITDDTGKSPLARLKEEQTGKAARPTYESDMQPITGLISEGMGIDIGEYIEISSQTPVVFAPGETEKHIIIRVLEDDESEGQEIMSFIVSEPGENTSLAEPMTTSIMINDDEPLVYSQLSLSAPVYYAENGKAEIIVRREDALYSYVTAKIHTVSDGEAVEGVNYSPLDAEIKLRPYQEEAVVEIPAAAAENLSFSVELYDLKGAVDGEYMSARVNIPDSDNADGQLSLSSEDTIELDNELYLIKGSGNKRELWTTKGTSYHAGDYYLPTADNISYGERTCVTSGSYMDTKQNCYDEKEKCGILWCDHGSWVRLGGEKATMSIQPKKYKSVWVDYKTLSKYEGALCGFEIPVNGTWRTSEYRAKKDRAWRGVPMADSSKHPAWDWGSSTLKFYAKKTGNGWIAPEMRIYGVALLYREFRIKLNQPADMEFTTASGKKKTMPPTTVSLSKKTAYTYDTITLSDEPSDGVRRGEFKGFNIGIGKKSFFYPTSSKSLTFDESLISLIDSNTDSVSMSGSSFYTELSITPEYGYKNVTIEVIASDDGKFSDSNLTPGKRTMHVGDELSADAIPAFDGYIYESYHRTDYINPGDSAWDFDANVTSGSNYGKIFLDGKHRRIILTPNFIDKMNRVEIQLDEEAKKYFEVLNTVPDSLLSNEDKGKKFLYTSGAAPYTALEPGRAYKVELTEKPECKGQYRPKISRYGTNDYVNGFVMDFLAESMHGKNIIKVTAEVAPTDIKPYAFSAAVQYSSVALRDSSAPLTNVAAVGATATVGANLSELYDSSGSKRMLPNRHTSEVDANGRTDILIDSAAVGDRVSVLITNNDVDQVCYLTIQSDAYDKAEKTYERLVADDEKEQNKYEKVTDSFICCSMQNLHMPVNTPYSPAIERVSYTSSSRMEEINTDDDAVPMYKDDIITLNAYVFDRGKSINRVEFVRRDREGNVKKTYTAVHSSTEENRYYTDIESDRAYNGDEIFVRVITNDTVLNDKHQIVPIEKAYPLLNTGLYFTVPNDDPDVSNHIKIETGQLGELPVLGDMAANIDTGKLSWKTVYADPENKKTSPKAEVVTLSISVKDIKEDSDTLKKLENGVHKEGKKTVEEQLKDFDPFKEAAEQDVKELAREFGKGKTQEEREATVKKWSESEKQKKRTELQNKQKKDSLADLGKMKWDVKFSVLLQFEYIYDETNNDYKFVGGQYLLGGALNIQKTWYWVVYGVPVYLNVSGYISLQMDGVYTKKGTDDVLARDLKSKINLLDGDIKSENPWGQIGLGGKLQPGIGLCGIVGVRGFFTIDGLFRILMDPDEKNPNTGGAMIKMSGGVGVDLFLFSFDYKLGSLEYKWGIYNKSKGLSLASADEAQISIRPLDRGNETEPDNISIASSLSPISKTDIVEGAMEYVRPKITDIGDGRLMMVYLRNGADRDGAANASSLVYRIKDGTGWSEPVYIDNDGTADGGSDILCDGNKIYIAWSSADAPVTANGENLDEVKKALGDMNIHMVVYDIESGEIGEKITVTNDKYLNSDVRLTKEDSRIALYYLKKDISQANSAEQLISTTSNYSTWAKRVYDPSSEEFVKLISDSGSEVDERLIAIKHPAIADALVYDYDVEDFTYDNGTEDVSDDVNYSIALYSVDTDGSIALNNDREVWMELTDITGGKSYYPIKLAEKEDIINPKLTKARNDVLITWLSAKSELNTVSIKNLFDGLRAQNGSADGSDTGTNGYKLMRGLSNEEAASENWGEILAEKAQAYMSDDDKEYFRELFSSINDIVNGTIASNPKNFGSEDRQTDMSDYMIVIGADDTPYLFWTGATADIKNYGRELYGSSYYTITEEWQEEWGAPEISHGWSNPVQLTDYGEVIDEMTIAVDENKNAVIIANMYEQTVDEKGDVCYGAHSLSEIDCVPVNSLNISDDEILLSDEYPVAGKEFEITIKVENNGLLASEGQTVTIAVFDNGKEVWNDTNTEDESKDVIYPGNVFSYTTKWKPESIDGDIEIVAEVKENGTGEIHRAVRKLVKSANIEFGESYAKDADEALNEWAQYENKEEMNDEAKVIDDLVNKNDKDFDYVVFIPVTNSGNIPMSDIEASAVTLDSEFNETGIAGVSEKISLDAKSSGLLAIAVEAKEDNYTKDGLLELMLKVNSGSERLDADNLHQTIYEDKNIGIIINDGAASADMKVGGTLELAVRAYPFDEEKNIYYFSDSPEAADVSEDGTVTAVGTGKARIYAVDIVSGSDSYIDVNVSKRSSGGSGGGSAARATAAPTQQPQATDSPQATPEASKPARFEDVPKDAWYYETVETAFEKGIMTGVDDNHFAPETEITRCMFLTALYRMADSPKPDREAYFNDVSPDAYYVSAVAWANETGVANGYSDTEFAPDDKITREQMSAMLYRYAKLCGKGFTGEWMFPLSFNDSAEVSEYAYEAMCWNTMNGIINGTDGNRLEPKANTTRAQAAAVLIRLDSIL